MEMSQKMKDAIDKATDELLSLSREEFFARLEENKDGPISRLCKETELAFPTEEDLK